MNNEPCTDKECNKHHCYYCNRHLAENHESWFCNEEEKKLYWVGTKLERFYKQPKLFKHS